MLYKDCNVFLRSSNIKAMFKDFEKYLESNVLISGDSDETGGFYVVIS